MTVQKTMPQPNFKGNLKNVINTILILMEISVLIQQNNINGDLSSVFISDFKGKLSKQSTHINPNITGDLKTKYNTAQIFKEILRLYTMQQ